MRKSTFNFDFSDIAPALKEFETKTRKQMESVGQKAVDYAKENGNYHDVTGRLRASNKYKVEQSAKGATLEVYNDAPYAADVEAHGKDVISGAGLYAEKLLKEL